MKKMYAKISVIGTSTPILIQEDGKTIYSDFILNYDLVSNLVKLAHSNDVKEITLTGIGTYVEVMKDKLLKEYCTQYSTNDIKISIENLSYD